MITFRVLLPSTLNLLRKESNLFPRLHETFGLAKRHIFSNMETSRLLHSPGKPGSLLGRRRVASFVAVLAVAAAVALVAAVSLVSAPRTALVSEETDLDYK